MGQYKIISNKICMMCNDEFNRRFGERIQNFNLRKYCGHMCISKSKSYSMQGEISRNKDKTQSQEAKEKNRLSHLGKKMSEESIRKRWGGYVPVENYKIRFKDKINKKARDDRLSRRKQLMSILGGEYCKKCGFNIFDALTVEHINNDGYLDRKKFKTTHVMNKYYIEHPEEAKEKLQIYCANCNQIKDTQRRRERVN